MANKTKAPAQPAGQGEETGQSRPPLSPELLKRLHGNMLKCRILEEQLRLLAQKGRIADAYPSTTGLEATIMGATIDLLPEDALAPSGRNLFAKAANGTSLKDLLAGLAARKARTKSAEQGNPTKCAVSPSTMAARLNVGVGMALAFRMQKKPNIVVALSDDTSASLDTWHEALSFAGCHRLPVVFVLENNLLFAEEGTVDELTRNAQAYGFPVMTVDGNDVVAVYRVCYEARERARQGYGPTLVESRTWRLHCNTIGSPGSPEAREQWKAHDPIPAMERYLRQHSLWDDRWNRQLIKEFKAEVRQVLLPSKKRIDSSEEAKDAYLV